jgi:hypothetical protein
MPKSPYTPSRAFRYTARAAEYSTLSLWSSRRSSAKKGWLSNLSSAAALLGKMCVFT